MDALFKPESELNSEVTKVKRKGMHVGAVVLAAGIALAGLAIATPANAAVRDNSVTVSTPAPSASGGTVTVCPGTTVNLNDQAGSALPLAQQKQILRIFAWRCAHPSTGPRGTDGTASQAKALVVHPDGTTDYGYLAAHLFISPGQMSATATLSSSPYGVYKELSCEYQVGGGSWTSCGTADGSGTSLSTMTAYLCPVPGQPATVSAFLTVNGADYWDDAYGTTE